MRYLGRYTPTAKLLVVPEENVMANPNDEWVGPNLIIREFAKAEYEVCGSRPVDPHWNDRGREVQQYEMRVKRLDVEFGDKVKQLYDSSMSKGMWKNTSAVQDGASYWAAGVLAYLPECRQAD